MSRACRPALPGSKMMKRIGALYRPLVARRAFRTALHGAGRPVAIASIRACRPGRRESRLSLPPGHPWPTRLASHLAAERC